MKRLIHIAGLIVAVLWLWHGGSAFAATTPRIALVIGNSNYKIAPSLPNPANDARLMAKTLRGLGFEVIEVIDADRDAMLLATFELQDKLIAAGTDAVGLFYYAGHGVQVGGENYFIPLKTEIVQEREVPVKAVSASFVLKQMEFANNRMNFVILDACRNNPFPASTRATTRGLARMNAPTGSLVAYSTGPGEVAADGVGDNSPYVLALTEAMQLPGVPAELMFKRVREQVLEATNDKQTPWEESSLRGGDFYFNVDVSVTVETPTAAASSFDERQMELSFWQSIKDANEVEMFKAYLEQYQEGTFAALARLRIKQLEKQQAAAETQVADEAQVAAEEEARRLAEAEAQRLAAEEEARRQAEIKRLAAEEEARRLAEAEAKRLAAEEEAVRKETPTVVAKLSVPTNDIDIAQLRKDRRLVEAIIAAYTQKNRLRGLTMASLRLLRVVKVIDENLFTLEISFQISAYGTISGAPAKAIVLVQKIGRVYTVFDFE